MANPEQSNTSALKSQLKELVKQRIEYDVSYRVEYIYTARYNEIHNGQCTVTRYSYDGTSNRVTYMKEYLGKWDSAWELF